MASFISDFPVSTSSAGTSAHSLSKRTFSVPGGVSRNLDLLGTLCPPSTMTVYASPLDVTHEHPTSPAAFRHEMGNGYALDDQALQDCAIGSLAIKPGQLLLKPSHQEEAPSKVLF
ncbi:hypothetical protein VTN96DRAFT_8666 [Rasamsonia emersonii]